LWGGKRVLVFLLLFVLFEVALELYLELSPLFAIS
jgi:hypothetical protein